MNRREFHAYSLSLGSALLFPLLTAQSGGAAPGDAYLDEESAGRDFTVQGEYVGKVDQRRFGCQVIARGNGMFEAALLPGGLPGAGWDTKTRLRTTGSTSEDKTRFGTDESSWHATLEDGKLIGTTADGQSFKLQKVRRKSPTEGSKPPAEALVLFNGSNTDEWTGCKTTPAGLLEPGGRTRREFKDFFLHVEFLLPFKPEARGQSRGNSGVYLQNRYEIQVLDSFGLDGKNNDCGSVYTQKAPSVNMCYPPLAWQTYDIDFQMARWNEAKEKTRNAIVTVRHNGVVVVENYEIAGPTGNAAMRPEFGEGGVLLLQNHGNPVRFRNIWLVEK